MSAARAPRMNACCICVCTHFTESPLPHNHVMSPCVCVHTAGMDDTNISRFMLIGGGDWPAHAIETFVGWVRAAAATRDCESAADAAASTAPTTPPPTRESGCCVLVVTWATARPDEALADVTAGLLAVDASLRVVEAPRSPLDAPGAAAAFLAALRRASGVYVTGGDQSDITRALEPAPELAGALRAAVARGLPYGGSSAGTAAVAHRMITGCGGDDGVLDGRQVATAPGLGLFRAGVLVDQHFLRRQRHNRLFGLLLDGPEALGLGIDESTAACVEHGSRVAVSGAGAVMVVLADAREQTLNIKVLRDGDVWVLPPPSGRSE